MADTRDETGQRQRERSILEQFLAELNNEMDTEERPLARKVTKGQALVKTMINDALDGDHRMLAHVLKLMERIDQYKEHTRRRRRSSRMDWDMVFTFYGKYKKHIEREIERRKEADRVYWSFEWFRPKSDAAPWEQRKQNTNKE